MTTTIPPTTTVAARAVAASKIYGKGDTEVRALDSIDVEFARAQYTAIMGPSGSGKSTLLHCLAGLDSLTSGHVYLGDIDLSTLSDKELTRVRRDRVGFVFQTFNLIPTLTALENITLPIVARRAQARPGVARPHRRHRRPARSARAPPVGAVGRSAATRRGRARARRPGPRSSSPTSRPATSTRASSAEILGFMQRAVEEFGQTIVMVTHDPIAASYSNRVVFLADGHIVDEIRDPTADAVLGKMRTLGGE